jgi:hypothetical protein
MQRYNIFSYNRLNCDFFDCLSPDLFDWLRDLWFFKSLRMRGSYKHGGITSPAQPLLVLNF